MRSHHLEPRTESVRVVFVYRNFAAMKGVSHVGLGVTCDHTARVLRQNGVHAEVWAVDSVEELETRISVKTHPAHETPVTHIIISAPWIESRHIARLSQRHTEIAFAVVCHSNVGFLGADPGAVTILKEVAALELGSHNVTLAGNSLKFTRWYEHAYRHPTTHLPNLYDTTTFRPAKPAWGRETLLVGCFGATRPLKNIPTAAAATLAVAQRLNVRTEFWVSGGRVEGGQSALNSVRAMFRGERGVELKVSDWEGWTEFRRTLGEMDLLMQPSFTESFNNVTADGVAESVPSVVSAAIDWVPPTWIADADDAMHVADTAIGILHNPIAAVEGQRALRHHVEHGLRAWLAYLHRVR